MWATISATSTAAGELAPSPSPLGMVTSNPKTTSRPGRPTTGPTAWRSCARLLNRFWKPVDTVNHDGYHISPKGRVGGILRPSSAGRRRGAYRDVFTGHILVPSPPGSPSCANRPSWRLVTACLEIPPTLPHPQIRQYTNHYRDYLCNYPRIIDPPPTCSRTKSSSSPVPATASAK